MPTPKNRAFFALFILCSRINKTFFLLLNTLLFFSKTSASYVRHHFSKQNAIACKQQGFSMVELLVAMLIFSIGLLGIASLQVTGMRMTRDAELIGQASLLASTMAEKIRSNASAINDVANWNQKIQTALPNGVGNITSANRTHTISVSWIESQDSTLANSQRSYKLVIQR